MNWTELLKDLLFAVITTAVPILTIYAIKYLKAHFENISENISKSEYSAMTDTVSEVLDLIVAVVTSTSQTYVDSLKSAGEFTEESQRVAFETTKSKILGMLSEETKEIIEIMYQDIDTWLGIQIEAAVRKIKK